jgi:hypothetical protein
MNHSFNTDMAKKYGLLEAVLLENIAHWLDKNLANNANFKEGRYWTYNSSKGFAQQFDYASAHQIRRALDSLVEKKVLIRSAFNKAGFDKTSWYTFADEFILSDDFPFGKFAKSCGSFANGSGKFAKPIPDINTDINADKSNSPHDCPHGKLLDLFGGKVPELPKPRVWTDKRMKDMASRWKWVMGQKDESGQPKHQTTDDGIQFFGRFFDYVATSDFLTGRNGAWTKCDLPWLMKEENFAKVIEGQYENKGGM